MRRYVYRRPSYVYWSRPQVTHWAPPVRPPAPTSFSLVAGGTDTELDWTLSETAHSEAQINVYIRVQGSGDPWTKQVYAANTTSGTITGLTASTTYEAYSTTQHIVDESLPSNFDTATTTSGLVIAAMLYHHRFHNLAA